MKTPVPRGAARSPARRHCDRSTRKLARLRHGYGGLKQVRALFSGHTADARRGTKDSNQKYRTRF